VADHRGNVLPFPGYTRPTRGWPVRREFPHIAVMQLEKLIMDLEQLCPQLSWSPQQWRIASTSSRIRISILRKTLHDLVGASPAGELSAIRWALELDDARLEVERWSDEVAARWQALQCSDIPFMERKRELSMFMTGRRELVQVLGSARDLIGHRVLGMSRWRSDQPIPCRLNVQQQSDFSRESPQVAAQGRARVDAGTVMVGTYDDLVRKLRDLDERLRSMVEMYREKPSALDIAMGKSAGNAVNPEEVVTELYRVMRSGVFAEDSTLRANRDLWAAICEQQDEFQLFLTSARRSMGIYTEVLWVYTLLQHAEVAVPKPGSVERIRQDKNAQMCERDRCIEAISDLYSKFSAMLAVL
jgi:hypothetical protein